MSLDRVRIFPASSFTRIQTPLNRAFVGSMKPQQRAKGAMLPRDRYIVVSGLWSK